MNDRTLRSLLDRIGRVDERSLTRAVGVVTDDSPLTVTIGGISYTDLPKFGSYVPAVDDPVYVLKAGEQWVVIGGINTAEGFSLGTNHAPGSIGGSDSLAATADRVYYVGVVIPADCTLTGIRFSNSSGATGTVRSALYNSSGTRVANCTSGATVVNTPMEVPFDSTYAAVPGVYFMALVCSGAPTWNVVFPSTPSGFVAGPGSGATATSITPPTSVLTSARMPAMGTY